MEDLKMLLQQNGHEGLAGFNEKSRSLFHSILKKRLAAHTVDVMMQLNESYQKCCQHLAHKADKLASLQALYWQELFLIWQRFALNQSWEASSLAQQQAAAVQFTKGYYLLHARHLEALVKIADNINDEHLKQIHVYIRHIIEECSPSSSIDNDDVLQQTLNPSIKGLLDCLENLFSHTDTAELS